jgi:methionyl-tRNA synthetase
MENKQLIILIAIIVWSIPWKGFALWKSARRGENIWFIILLLINTAGILEILYLFFFSNTRKVMPKQYDESTTGLYNIK